MDTNSPQTPARHQSGGSTSTGALDYASTKKAALVLRAVNHKIRSNMLRLIGENKRMNVTEIYVRLRLEQSVASQHLAILRRENIVTTMREGKVIHYSLNYPRIIEIVAVVGSFVRNPGSDD